MINEKIPTVSADFLNNINMSIPFMVWSRPGNGTLHHVMSHFDSSAYHVHRIITPQVSTADVGFIPVLLETGVELKEADWLTKLNTIREVEGKKIVLIFDDVSSATPSGAEVFGNAVLHRETMGFKLAEGDIVVGMGLLDPNGNPFNSSIPRLVYNHLAHYAVDFTLKAA